MRASRVKSALENNHFAKYALLLLTMLGTSMVMGDGVLTPCISVLSSVGGIKQATTAVTEGRIVWTSVGILICLFLVQRFGTDKVGYSFAPIIVLWFLMIGCIDIFNFIKYDPSVAKAFNPKYIFVYFRRNRKDTWISLGGVVLASTGTEAMFADLRHFTMEASLKRLEDYPKVIAAWEVYSIAADCYKKVGILDKAVNMLKKSEAVVPLKQQTVACDLLISRYSGMGLKEDVYRLWNLKCSISKKVSNASYICVLASLSNLDDIEGAEKVLEEWESKCFCDDFQVPYQLVAVYCKKGQFDKAESFIKRAIEEGDVLEKYGWKPRSDNVAVCLADLSRKGDVEGAEEFSRLSKLFH
ncbi:hypothetical protein ACLOJK_037821 [Asimina triloba]